MEFGNFFQIIMFIPTSLRFDIKFRTMPHTSSNNIAGFLYIQIGYTDGSIDRNKHTVTRIPAFVARTYQIHSFLIFLVQ